MERALTLMFPSIRQSTCSYNQIWRVTCYCRSLKIKFYTKSVFCLRGGVRGHTMGGTITFWDLDDIVSLSRWIRKSAKIQRPPCQTRFEDPNSGTQTSAPHMSRHEGTEEGATTGSPAVIKETHSRGNCWGMYVPGYIFGGLPNIGSE